MILIGSALFFIAAMIAMKYFHDTGDMSFDVANTGFFVIGSSLLFIGFGEMVFIFFKVIHEVWQLF